eukprot:TRINITY_DN15770_c0_g1_i1.p1 TRINITY_DN15770_c0_g1~~TRINITY_DN15770_c0_g1_i1.p1  ORF type:complete len:410 (-),score=140.92 TRINITY_DN15770_c0_g1_i1:47-1183(-)
MEEEDKKSHLYSFSLPLFNLDLQKIVTSFYLSSFLSHEDHHGKKEEVEVGILEEWIGKNEMWTPEEIPLKRIPFSGSLAEKELFDSLNQSNILSLKIRPNVSDFSLAVSQDDVVEGFVMRPNKNTPLKTRHDENREDSTNNFSEKINSSFPHQQTKNQQIDYSFLSSMSSPQSKSSSNNDSSSSTITTTNAFQQLIQQNPEDKVNLLITKIPDISFMLKRNLLFNSLKPSLPILPLETSFRTPSSSLHPNNNTHSNYSDSTNSTTISNSNNNSDITNIVTHNISSTNNTSGTLNNTPINTNFISLTPPTGMNTNLNHESSNTNLFANFHPFNDKVNIKNSEQVENVSVVDNNLGDDSSNYSKNLFSMIWSDTSKNEEK